MSDILHDNIEEKNCIKLANKVASSINKPIIPQK